MATNRVLNFAHPLGEAARKDSFEVATTERRPSPQRPIPLEDLLNGVALVDDPPVDNGSSLDFFGTSLDVGIFARDSQPS